LRQLHSEQKIPYTSMAIFYRTNAQSRPLEEVLRLSGIPYVIYGGLSFYERAEVKDALAYLRIFHQPEDSVSFKRIINVPTRGIGKTTIERIENLAFQQQSSFYEAALAFTESPKLKIFLEWFEKIAAQKEGLPLVEFLRLILESSGYVESLSKQGSIEAEERMSNLNEMVASIADFEKNFPHASLNEYLEQVALISDLDQKSEGGVLPLMTLHLAKGLEFRVVAVVGLEEGLLPHSRSQNEIEELEEERRLFYVGMTRAEERLIVTHAWRRFVNGQEQYGLPSRFLEEIPGELVERMDKAKERERDWEFDQTGDYGEDQRQPRRGPFGKTIDQRPTARFKTGIRVRHPDFGVGYVAASEKTSLGEKVTVKFGNGTIKKLIAEYAHLEILN